MPGSTAGPESEGNMAGRLQPTTVVVAPTAFKGTLGPNAVARALAGGVAAAWPATKITVTPLSDGGNGLIESYAAYAGGVEETHEVSGPLGSPTYARLLRSGGAAVVESAEACGLHLVPVERRDPLRASTLGVGQLLLAAARGGAAEIILGLGGSATVDGGSGMARALGWRFLDSEGRPLTEGGGALPELARIQRPGAGLGARVVTLCDVDNPLLGERGAARVYGPQKGAGPAAAKRLEAGLARLAEVIGEQLGVRVAELAGAGAAGGLGAGARAFLGAELVSGAAWMIEKVGLRDLISRADLLVSGEGRFDAQSGMGKLTGRVVEAARSAGVPVLLVCGSVEGPLPPGVTAVDGGGRELAESDLVRLTRDACLAGAGRDRL